jgi:manganese-transporting P-type ATPase
LYSTERVTANNAETFLFILFLLLWAIAASGYVLYHGLADPDRDRFKLALNCIMILTSVIPPELPMELTIAVNASLLALARKAVFCTEPFRIPMAGKVTTCCFDKTGTLTSDHMELEGVAGLAGGSSPRAGGKGEGEEGSGGGHHGLQSSSTLWPQETARVLACCQSLVQVERGLVGDPVERAAVSSTGWTCKQETVTSPPSPGGGTREVARIMHRFHFSSALKRMSVVVRCEGGVQGGEAWWVLSKGAPEAVKKMLAKVPAGYDARYKSFAAQGARVLALGCKRLSGEMTPSAMRHLPRDQAESGLEFAGECFLPWVLLPCLVWLASMVPWVWFSGAPWLV